MSSGFVTTEVLQIDPKLIQANPENPRILFYPEHLEILKTSIKNNGILVPITVFKKPSERKWTILDGERRWKCALELNLKQIPANEIPPPTKRQNILLMFNIHKVREEWELVPTALKIQVLIGMMPDASEKELAEMTGMSQPRVKNCIRILRYPKKYLDMTLIEDTSRRIRGEFFSQLEEALEKLDKDDYEELGYTKYEIVDIMIEKYKNKEFTNLIVEFRTLRRVLTASKKGISKPQIHNNVKEYLRSKPKRDKKTGKITSKAMSVNELYERTAFNVYAEDQIIGTAEKLNTVLYKFDLHQVPNKTKVRNVLIKLRETIDQILSVVVK